MGQRIILFSGQIMSAKSISAAYLQKILNQGVASFGYSDYREYHYHLAAFGNALKGIYGDIFGLSRVTIDKWKRSPEPLPGHLKTIREGLQFFGDGARTFYPNVWVDRLFRDYPIENLIIDDDRGGINVAILRPGFVNDNPHPSEAELKVEIKKLVEQGEGPVSNSIFDYFILNDGPIEELYKKVGGLVSFIKKWYEDANPDVCFDPSTS